jgi:murein L,D-transpeptidase YafK
VRKLGLLAIFAVGVIALTWLSMRSSTTCSVCVSDFEAMLFPPEPEPAPLPAALPVVQTGAKVETQLMASPPPPLTTLSLSPSMSFSPPPLSPGLAPPFPLVPVPPSMPSEPAAFPPPLQLPYAAPPAHADWQKKAPADRLFDVRSRLLPRLHEELAARGLKPGARAFLRAFKESHELELWLRSGSGGDWVLYRNYPVHALSGALGPKLREGDGQTPEGVYEFGVSSLNPSSMFHLSFNIGYPNAYDRHHQRTGTHIMVHGSNVSIGCLAMSDPAIEEIYLLVAEALEAGQSKVPIHIFPFRMTEERMAAAADSPHAEFWRDLKAIHDSFESLREVPRVQVSEGRYSL